MPKRAWTTPDQHAWLSERLSGFVQAQQQKRTSEWLAPIYQLWLELYPCDKPTAGEITAASGNADTAKGLLDRKAKERVYWWFHNHARATSTGTDARGLLKIATKSKLLQPFQAYSQLYYDKKLKKIIDEEYEKHTGQYPADSAERQSRFIFSTSLTKKLLDEETAKVKAEVETYRKEQAVSKEIKLEDSGDDEDALSEEKRQEMNQQMQSAIDRLPATMKKLLESIHKLTGWAIFCSVGGPSPKLGGGMQTYTLSYGSTKDTNEQFPDTVEDWEGSHVEPFDAFLSRAFPPEICERVALRSSNDNTQSTAPDLSRNATPSTQNTPGPSGSKSKPPAKSQQVRSGSKLSAYELDRLRNIARNKKLLEVAEKEVADRLGVEPPSAPLPKKAAKGTMRDKGKASTAGGSQSGNRLGRKGNAPDKLIPGDDSDLEPIPEGGESDDDGVEHHVNLDGFDVDFQAGDDDDDEDKSDKNGGDSDEERAAEGDKAPAANPTDALNAAWTVKAKEHFLSFKNMGKNWNLVITGWLDIEAQLGYPDGKERSQWLSAKERPLEIKWWNSRGKKLSAIPEFKTAEFALSWRRWWESLQPDWRSKETWPPSREIPTNEDWSVLL